MPSAGASAAVAVMALLAVLGRITLRSWLHPGAFFTLVWLFMVVFSLSGPLAGVEQYPVWHGALWWIALTLASVYVGSAIGMRAADAPRCPTRMPAAARDLPGIVPLVALAAVCSLVFTLLMWEVAPGAENPPLPLQVAIGLHYMGAPLAGVLFGATRERRYRALSLVVLVAGMSIGFMGAARQSIVLQFTHWFAGYFTMVLFASRGRPIALFSPARVFGAAVSLAVVLSIGVVFYSFRAVPFDTPPVERLRQYKELLQADVTRSSWEYNQPGIFGQVAMFSAYFEMAWARPPAVPKFPQETAAGIHRVLGYEPPEALHIDVGGKDTNIFTIFKPAIEDFTMPGALLVFFGWGAVSAWAYRKVQLGSLWPGGVLVYYYSHATNLGGTYLTYNSLTGALLIVAAYLWYVEALGPLRAAREDADVERSVRPCWAPTALTGDHFNRDLASHNPR